MSRHRFGAGEYRYFAEPFPDPVTGLKEALYPKLLPIARSWWGRLGRPGLPRRGVTVGRDWAAALRAIALEAAGAPAPRTAGRRQTETAPAVRDN